MGHVSIVGNVTREPELKFTASGQATVTFGIAENRYWKDAAGVKQEAVSFFNVVCWRDLAENVAETVSKGARVMVSGRLEQRSWTAEVDGVEVKRSAVEVIADEVGPSLRWATAKVVKVDRTPAPEQNAAAA